jgi:predicted XRE-type DNA-binding protein
MEILLNMSTKEISRLEVTQRLSEKRMSQKEAGEILHLGKRK